MKKCVMVVFSALMCLTNGVCFADVINVDQSGGGDYTTIQAGINVAYADDTVTVGPGIYNENVIIDKNLNLIGSGPNFTTIEATQDGITVKADISALISGFAITGGNFGINLDNGRVTCIIKNCIIIGCGSHGIYSYNEDGPNITIFDNNIILNKGRGVFIDEGGGSSSSNIQGNIISFNGEHGIYLFTDIENISYNNLYSNSSGDYYSCSAGLGDISQNSKFIDQNAGNYALRSDSPCIDTGRPGASHNDPDGTRNDMGAFAGPDSAQFWPYISGGPVVTDISITPASASQGTKLSIKAKGRVR